MCPLLREDAGPTGDCNHGRQNLGKATPAGKEKTSGASVLKNTARHGVQVKMGPRSTHHKFDVFVSSLNPSSTRGCAHRKIALHPLKTITFINIHPTFAVARNYYASRQHLLFPQTLLTYLLFSFCPFSSTVLLFCSFPPFFFFPFR